MAGQVGTCMCTCNRKKDVLAVVMKVRKHVFFFFLIVTTAVTATYLKPADGYKNIFYSKRLVVSKRNLKTDISYETCREIIKSNTVYYQLFTLLFQLFLACDAFQQLITTRMKKKMVCSRSRWNSRGRKSRGWRLQVNKIAWCRGRVCSTVFPKSRQETIDERRSRRLLRILVTRGLTHGAIVVYNKDGRLLNELIEY